MKRPLLWAALLLTLGVLIINSRPESRDKWLLRKPSVRLALEKSSSGYFPVALKGTVLWAEEKEGRPVYRIDCGKKYGTVLVYGSEEAVHEEEPSELAGSTVRVSGTAFLFQPSENPGQFDVQAYYDDLGIYFGVSQAEVWLDAPKKASFRRFLCRLSAAYKTVIRETTEKEEGDFLLLLSQGDRSESGEEMKKEAAALSALQLISVSGFIISSIGMLFYRILRKRSTDLFLCAGIPFFLIFFYFLFLGAPVSMIRALILFLMRILAPLLKRRFDTLSAASLSVLLLGITRPTYLLLPSMPFYLAVLLSQGLVCPVVRKSLRKQSLMASLTLSFFSMQAALLPVQILSRNSFSPYGMLLVYFLLPVRTAVILFTLAGSFIGVVFGRNAYGIVRLLLYLPGKMRLLYSLILSSFIKLPFSTIHAGKPPFMRMILYLILFLLAPLTLIVRDALKKKGCNRDRLLRKSLDCLFPAAYAVLLFFGMLFLRTPENRSFTYTMLSVGQGDSGIVRAGPVVIGVDCGSSSRDDAGSLFTDACACYGIRRVDFMTLSHGDLDHVNGLRDILNAPGLEIGEIWIPDLKDADILFQEELRMAKEAHVPVRRMGAGDRSDRNGTVLEVLHPAHGAALEGNESSLVLKVTSEGRSVLFTGDISEETEKRLRYSDISTDILKVAHHGSRFSSGDAFLKAVRPDLALVSYGRNNTYGHPSDETVERFRNIRVPLYGTGRSGAVEAVLKPKEISLMFYGGRSDKDLPLNLSSGH